MMDVYYLFYGDVGSGKGAQFKVEVPSDRMLSFQILANANFILKNVTNDQLFKDRFGVKFLNPSTQQEVEEWIRQSRANTLVPIKQPESFSPFFDKAVEEFVIDAQQPELM